MDPELGRSRAYLLSVGQLAEWLVWTHLVASSGGDLHVFLPLKDDGIDGMVHRISTDEYARVQVKGRLIRQHALRVMVAEHELADYLGFVVIVKTREGEASLGATALVVRAPDFRRLAHRNETASLRPVYETNIALPPPRDSRWTPFLVSPHDIGERLLPSGAGLAAAQVALPADWVSAGRLGLRAEMELLRRASDCARLGIFKAFPDLEPDEYLLYELNSRGLVGIQVKAMTLESDRGGHMNVYRPALRPSPRTWFVLFLTTADGPDFYDHCAVMPSTWVAEHLEGRGDRSKLWVMPGLSGHLAQWRGPLTGLGERLAELATSGI